MSTQAIRVPFLEVVLCTPSPTRADVDRTARQLAMARGLIPDCFVSWEDNMLTYERIYYQDVPVEQGGADG